MKKNLWLLLLFTAAIVKAQQADTSFIDKGILYAKEVHSKRIQGESLLYNGSDFKDYKPLHDEYPYFLSNDWVLGSVLYDGQLYNNIYLQYDISTDNVIVDNNNFSTKIQLIKNRIQYFTLENHIFIQVNHSSIQSGFYELLYDGPTKVIVKRQKKAQEQISSLGQFREFLDKPKHYIFKNSGYTQVNNKKSVLKLLHKHKQELNKQFRTKNIKFKSNKDASIIMLAELYDHLSQ